MDSHLAAPTSVSEVYAAIHTLQAESLRFDKERTQWAAERSQLMATVARLQGLVKAGEATHQDMLRRTKMLEWALKQERLRASQAASTTPAGSAGQGPPVVVAGDAATATYQDTHATDQLAAALAKLAKPRVSHILAQRYMAQLELGAASSAPGAAASSTAAPAPAAGATMGASETIGASGDAGTSAGGSVPAPTTAPADAAAVSSLSAQLARLGVHVTTPLSVQALRAMLRAVQGVAGVDHVPAVSSNGSGSDIAVVPVGQPLAAHGRVIAPTPLAAATTGSAVASNLGAVHTGPVRPAAAAASVTMGGAAAFNRATLGRGRGGRGHRMVPAHSIAGGDTEAPAQPSPVSTVIPGGLQQSSVSATASSPAAANVRPATTATTAAMGSAPTSSPAASSAATGPAAISSPAAGTAATSSPSGVLPRGRAGGSNFPGMRRLKVAQPMAAATTPSYINGHGRSADATSTPQPVPTAPPLPDIDLTITDTAMQDSAATPDAPDGAAAPTGNASGGSVTPRPQVASPVTSSRAAPATPTPGAGGQEPSSATSMDGAVVADESHPSPSSLAEVWRQLSAIQATGTKTPTRTWKPKMTLRGHLDVVRRLVWHPTRPLLFTASDDGTVKAWNLSSLSRAVARRSDIDPTRTFRGHTSEVLALCMCAGRVARAYAGAKADTACDLLVTGGADATVRLWRIPLEGAPTSAYAVGASSILALTTLHGHTNAVWDVVALDVHANGAARDDAGEATSAAATTAAAALDTSLLLCSAGADAFVRLWRITPTEASLHASYSCPKLLARDDVVPTCLRPHATYAHRVYVGTNHGDVFLLDTSAGAPVWHVHRLPPPRPGVLQSVHRLAHHPTLPMLLVVANDKSVRLVDAGDGTVVKCLSVHANQVSGVAVDPAGLSFATVSHGGDMRVWSVTTLACVQEVTAHRLKWDEGALDVAFHASAGLLASCGADACIKLFQ